MSVYNEIYEPPRPRPTKPGIGDHFNAMRVNSGLRHSNEIFALGGGLLSGLMVPGANAGINQAIDTTRSGYAEAIAELGAGERATTALRDATLSEVASGASNQAAKVAALAGAAGLRGGLTAQRVGGVRNAATLTRGRVTSRYAQPLAAFSQQRSQLRADLARAIAALEAQKRNTGFLDILGQAATTGARLYGLGA